MDKTQKRQENVLRERCGFTLIYCFLTVVLSPSFSIMFPFDKAVYFSVTFPLSDNPYALWVTQGAAV